VWHTIKGYAAGLAALIACPCHLPPTLPPVLSLAAGMALAAWLAANTALVYVVSTALFLASLLLAGKWLFVDEEPACRVDGRLQPTEQAAKQRPDVGTG
jgi:hypothetical protein